MEPQGPDGLVIVLCTVPDVATGERLAERLVAERAIACANLVPGLTSIFRWKGEVSRESEVLLLMKTPRAGLEHLLERVPQLHPYEVPEVLAVPVEAGLAAYCRWVVEETIKEQQ